MHNFPQKNANMLMTSIAFAKKNMIRTAGSSRIIEKNNEQSFFEKRTKFLIFFKESQSDF